MFLPCLNVHVQNKKFSVTQELASTLASTFSWDIISLHHLLYVSDRSTLELLAGSPTVLAQTADKESERSFA